MNQRPDVAVVGTGNWGTTLALLLARAGRLVTLVARDEAELATLRADGENRRFLPGHAFPPELGLATDLAAACQARVVLLAVPSRTMRQNIRQVGPLLAPDSVALSCAKGIEAGTLLCMSQVMREELPPERHGLVGALSGPNIAHEIAAGLPATTVVAAADPEATLCAQQLLTTRFFRVYRSSDVTGIELAGALKNIIALGAGIGDGMGVGENAKAAFITRGLAEITRLGAALGANPLTFAGLGGLGDLLATCSSPHSRNRRLGEALARGQSLADAQQALGQVAEGVGTTITARELAAAHQVELPIADELHRVLFEGKPAFQAGFDLMQRDPKDELAGLERVGIVPNVPGV
ncbi:MAG TPA: NAD(P)H-dependent glycerol-3-phosphate dehydrogenase [Herpetosiphonaceae bacterium]